GLAAPNVSGAQRDPTYRAASPVDPLADVEQMVVIVPINANIDVAEHIGDKHRKKWRERMWALHASTHMAHNPVMVATSILISIVASAMALWLTFNDARRPSLF